MTTFDEQIEMPETEDVLSASTEIDSEDNPAEMGDDPEEKAEQEETEEDDVEAEGEQEVEEDQ